MRHAKIINGKAVDFYNVDAETLATLREINPDAIYEPCGLEVLQGWKWDGEKFINPSLSTPPEPIPTPTKTRESVVMELNSIVDSKKREYLQPWPNTSQSDLWPLFDAELVRIKTDANPSPELYPALLGALSVKLETTPSIEQLQTFADAIIGAKKAHAIELAKLENAYQYTLQAFGEDSAINIAATFEEAYGA